MRKGTHDRRAAWTRPLLLAALLVGLGIGLLLTLRARRAPEFGPDREPGVDPLAPGRARDAEQETTATQPRRALPASAWAVLDLDLARIAGFGGALARLPEALGQLDCDRLAPPPRVALALLAPRADEGLEFAVAATGASPAFLRCTRDHMLQTGSARDVRSETWPGGFEVLSRPAGLRLALHAERGLVLFWNAAVGDDAELVELLSGTRPNAAEHGLHASLHRSLAPAPITLTVQPPEGWLEHFVSEEEAGRSPLRFLRASAWALRDEGLFAFVDCAATPDGSGCRALARFLEQAHRDVLGELPPGELPEQERAQLIQGFRLEPVGPTRLELTWLLPARARSHLLERLLARAL